MQARRLTSGIECMALSPSGCHRDPRFDRDFQPILHTEQTLRADLAFAVVTEVEATAEVDKHRAHFKHRKVSADTVARWQRERHPRVFVERPVRVELHTRYKQ